MKFVVLAVLLVLGVVCAMAVEQKESLKPAEQVYLASPYAYSAYGAYPAVAYGAYGAYGYYGR